MDKRSSKPRAAFLACVVANLAGCSGTVPVKPIKVVADPDPPRALPLGLLAEERRLLGERSMDWGLALSGGGLRSGFFSLGVLKALYDKGVLDDVDIISTVSGGGYTGYWLYANHLADRQRGERFGAASLSDGIFPRRLCELMTKSNFVPYGKLRGILRKKLSARTVEVYEQSLLRTFGSAEPQDGLRLPDLAPTMARHEAPYLIQNATIILPPSDRSWQRKLIEFTPVFYGTSDIGYLRWGVASDTGPLPMRKTTAVSGAAFPPLKQTLPLRHPQSGLVGFRAHDGGKSENLGAMALIRRGIPNVIVADAEHDPGYVFDAYRTLQAGLALYGLDLKIPDIDTYLEKRKSAPYAVAVAKGRVTRRDTGEQVSAIYYIKAAMPHSIEADLARERAPGSPGAIAQKAYYTALEASAGTSGAWQCPKIQAARLPTKSWAAFNVASYSDWLGKSIKARFVRVVSNATGVAALRIEFPQYSTGDQSFYVDQAQAFIGLGYLEGNQVETGSAR